MLLNLLKGINRARKSAVTALLEQGLQSQARGDPDAAERAYRTILGRDSDHADAAHLLGVLLHRTGRAEEAVAWLERARGSSDAPAELHLHLGSACQAAGRYADAEASFLAAQRLAPHLLAVQISLGVLYKELGRFDEALRAFERALALDDRSAEIWHNLGNLQRDLGDENAACMSFERALSLDPHMLEARFSRSLSLLAQDDFDEGWKEYEVRLQLPRSASDLRSFPFPVWQGESLASRTILVWGEQGIGDEMLFASMYRDLISLGAHCVFECSAKLVSLFGRSFPDATVVARTRPSHPATQRGIDFQIAAGSLGRYLRSNSDSFSSHAHSLKADPERVAFWQRELARLGPSLKVGFSWRSRNMGGERARAYAPLSDWDPLLRLTEVHWICLQYDDCEAELDALRTNGRTLNRYRLDYFNDLDEVSALTCALDMVISAPTVVSAHAAALGIPVWQISYGADWQVRGMGGLPWFSNVTRYSRRWNESWEPAFDRVAAALREHLENHRQ